MVPLNSRWLTWSSPAGGCHLQDPLPGSLITSLRNPTAITKPTRLTPSTPAPTRFSPQGSRAQRPSTEPACSEALYRAPRSMAIYEAGYEALHKTHLLRGSPQGFPQGLLSTAWSRSVFGLYNLASTARSLKLHFKSPSIPLDPYSLIFIAWSPQPGFSSLVSTAWSRKARLEAPHEAHSLKGSL